MKKLLVTLSVVLFTQIPTAGAEGKNNHFPSLESHDVQTALCNIQTYNEKLTAITSQPELTALDMVKVHELTYTLENAVNFLKVSLEDVSVDLEEVHMASEKLDQDTIKLSGQKYLTTTSLLLSKKQC
jgi:hypothetical protein